MKFRNWLEGNRELASMYKSRLGGVPQDPHHHPEGDVLAHSRLVRGAIKQAALILGNYGGELGEILSNIDFNLNAEELEILALAAWGHDVGKVTATGVDNGKIHARGHQDRVHFEPQLRDLGVVASEKTRNLYLRNRELIDFLILHHMDLMTGSFSRAFIAENFEGGRVKNTLRMKLLLVLMWADKLGRGGGGSLASHERALLKSASITIRPKSEPFQGSPSDMVKTLRQRGLDNNSIRNSLQKKYGLSDEEISSLLSEVFHAWIKPQRNLIPSEIYKNPSANELRKLARHSQVRMFLYQGDVYCWNPWDLLHGEVERDLKLGADRIPLYATLYRNQISYVFITDDSRRTKWHESPQVIDAILSNENFMKLTIPNFSATEVGFYNEDIVGRWDQMSYVESVGDVAQFVQDFRLYLQHEREALANDRERYLEWVEETMADRLARSGLSLDDPEAFYMNGNLPKSPIRNGMILAGMYYRVIGKDIWSQSQKKRKRLKESVGEIGIRYTHKDGRGLMNNSSLNYDKLDDDEYAEIEDGYLGLRQPPTWLHNQRVLFVFTPEGEQRHRRLIELLTKASKRGVRRDTINLSGHEIVWDSGDGQLGLSDRLQS